MDSVKVTSDKVSTMNRDKKDIMATRPRHATARRVGREDISDGGDK